MNDVEKWEDIIMAINTRKSFQSKTEQRFFKINLFAFFFRRITTINEFNPNP
jgi:hypothetical protein